MHILSVSLIVEVLLVLIAMHLFKIVSTFHVRTCLCFCFDLRPPFRLTSSVRRKKNICQVNASDGAVAAE
jgi:hypothetical protein